MERRNCGDLKGVLHKMRVYTGESLDMLKSEEGQKNAVFACFGSAAQHAQLLEAALSDFLVVWRQMRDETSGLQGRREEGG